MKLQKFDLIGFQRQYGIEIDDDLEISQILKYKTESDTIYDFYEG